MTIINGIVKLLVGAVVWVTILLPNTVTWTPCWHILQHAGYPFAEDWIHIGTLTFRKRTRELAQLHKLTLLWDGPPIDELFVSLYRTEIDHPFRAIDSQWVCNGVWYPKNQYVRFRFSPSQQLSTITHFHCVASVSLPLFKLLPMGRFFYAHEDIPPSLFQA